MLESAPHSHVSWVMDYTLYTCMLYSCVHIIYIPGNASGIVLTVFDFPPGDYILTIEVRDVDGNTRVVTTPINLSGVLSI